MSERMPQVAPPDTSSGQGAAADGPDEVARHGPISTSDWRQYGLALATVLGVSVFNLWLERGVGYQAIALVYLLAIVLLSLFVGRGPILMGAGLTAVGWAFVFAPPRYSFHVAGFHDQMMFGMYFVVSLATGQLTARLRAAVAELQRLRDAELKSRLLAESERLGRTLLSSVSHELRTPIAAISSAATSFRASGPLTPVQESLAGEIDMAAARLNRVVQSLLSAARLQSGQIKPDLDWCDVSDLIRVTLRNMGNMLREHPVEMRVAPQLPLVRADFVLMEQALANLLVNAAVHTPPGTPMEIGARTEDRRLIIEVGDRGPGLTADLLERGFELFYRAPGAKPGGAGLGLAIVKGFVEAQGGQVQAANRAGGGAVFSIYLPLVDPPELAEETL